MTDDEMLKFLQGFRYKETKKQVTNMYIQGKINKEEFFKRMKEAK